MKQLCLFLIFEISLFSCGYKSEYSLGKGELVKTYYENGNLKTEGWINSDLRDSCWNYYKNDGSLKAKGCYDLGLKTDVWYYYSENKIDSIDWGIYSDSLKGYQLNFPRHWELIPNYKNSGVLAMFNSSKANPFYDNINVLIIEYESDFDLELAVKDYIKNYGEGIEVSITDKLQINSNEALLTLLNASERDTHLKIFQAAIKSQNNLYLISCFSDNEEFVNYQDLYKEVIFSFKI